MRKLLRTNQPRTERGCGMSTRDPVRPTGKALSGKSTLNRLELTLGDASANSLYKKIATDPEVLDDFFISE